VVAALVAAVALSVNLSNSLGAVAGRADKTLAERAKVAEARKDSRALLARIEAERAEMRVASTTAEAVQAAHEAVAAAERARAAECDQRGRFCRQRESEEQAKRDALAQLLANYAATEKAATLDKQAAALRERLEGLPPISSPNPLADNLGRILSLPADTAATAQQVAMVVVVELLIAFSLIAWELLTPVREPITGAVSTAKRGKVAAIEPELTVAATTPAPIARHRLGRGVTVIEAGRPAGDVAKFAVARLRPAAGSSIPIPTLYRPYREWCEAHGFRALPQQTFTDLFEKLCDLSGFTLTTETGAARCLNLELVA
jgi:hypothetical protein